MELGLEGKRVVITGGTRGIGLATARAFLEEGASVVIGARNKAELDSVVKDLSSLGTIIPFQFDALDTDSFYSLADFAAEKLGGIDAWVNNVGASHPKSNGDEYTADDVRWTEAMCFESAVHGTQAAVRHMKENGGAIVNISSLAARVGTAGRITIYGPLKAAVRLLASNQAAEYAVYGIRVNCVMPGFTMTETVARNVSDADKSLVGERTLIRRMARPEEIAYPIVFLCSDKASYITGTTLEVSGGRDVVLNPMYSYENEGKL